MEQAAGDTEHFDSDSDSGWKEGLPWLYYEHSVKTTLRTGKRFDMRQSFDTDRPSYERFKYLQFHLAVYTMEGEYLGM